MTLKGKQKNLDKNNDWKISGEDFKLMSKKNKLVDGGKVKMKYSDGGSIQVSGSNFSGVY